MFSWGRSGTAPVPARDPIVSLETMEPFAHEALVGSRDEYDNAYHDSIQEPEAFWAERRLALDWSRAPDRILQWDLK